MKPFETLGAIETAELTEEQTKAYIKEIGDEALVLREVSECRKRLDSMGVSYRKETTRGTALVN